MAREERSPAVCGRCGGRDFEHRVCAAIVSTGGKRRRCGWRPPCPACGGEVAGRADRVYCSDRCRMRGYYRAHPPLRAPEAAVEVLADLDDDRFRELVSRIAAEHERRAAEREGRDPRPGGRLRVRWGVYQPKA